MNVCRRWAATGLLLGGAAVLLGGTALAVITGKRNPDGGPGDVVAHRA